ncbi:MAG: long-chain fatty acid--CoA ligase [Paludibacteraceae bacterium]|nr:long-chain fatty acid--CoA ligase [Paludibacteraceae bacterium]
MNSFHIGRLAFDNAKRFGDKTALKYRDDEEGVWKPLTWNQVAASVRRAAKAFLSIGIKEQDKVAIYSQNSHETIIVDLALQAIRAVAVPLYATSSSEQVKYIVDDAQCAMIFVGEQYQYDQTIKVLHQTNVLKKVITVDPKINLNGIDTSMAFSDFLKYGDGDEQNAELEKRQSELSQDDLATLIYTSGTSGEPKGVMIMQYNLTHQMRIHEKVMPCCDETRTSMMFLPASHIFERAWDYLCMYRGAMIFVNKNPKEILQSIKETRPNMMCAVPRFWEKVYAGVHEKIEKMPGLIKKLMYHAIAVGKKRNLDYVRFSKSVPFLTELQYKIFKKTLFEKVKKELGLENSMYFPCAGSQLSESVCEFLMSLGFDMVVGYGLTESTATVSCFHPAHKYHDLKSVGEVMPECEVKIGENDEILLKGNLITPGYYNKPEINATAFTDGWFHTGDAGKLENGILYITDRIKDLFKTSNGKYIAPQQIENLLVTDKYIDQVAVIGDLRKFVTALIVPDYGAVKEYAEQMKIEYKDMEDLLSNPKITSLIEGRIANLQEGLAKYEQIKRFKLLSKPFSSDNGELTLTLKLKRKVINEHYNKEIEYMYSY